MLKEMMKQCCGTDGSPDFDEMVKYMERHDRASKYDAVGWALFFIWVGFAWLTDLGWGIGLLGVAVVMLGEQAARAYFKVRVERFWIFVGAIFALAGLWELYEVQQPLPALLLMLVGIVLLISMFRSRRPKGQ